MELWVTIKHNNICIIRVTEGEERDKGLDNILDEIMAEIFPN